MSDPIFHVALAPDWAAAQSTGQYEISTVGVSLADEGFIHASRADQWRGVLERFYGEVTDDLVLLEIDPERLTAPVVEEPAVPGAEETFPHVYGPIEVSAVKQVHNLSHQAAD